MLPCGLLQKIASRGQKAATGLAFERGAFYVVEGGAVWRVDRTSEVA